MTAKVAITDNENAAQRLEKEIRTSQNMVALLDVEGGSGGALDAYRNSKMKMEKQESDSDELSEVSVTLFLMQE